MKMIQPFQQSVFYSIEKAIKVYRRFASERIRAAEPELTINQALLLNLLSEDSNIGQHEMAEILFKDVAAITRMVELLVKRGLVTRAPHPSDRRRKRLLLSPKGKAQLQLVIPITSANREQAMVGFSESEKEELMRLLNKLILNCQTATHE